MKLFSNALCVASCSIFVAACGGGGSGDSAPPRDSDGGSGSGGCSSYTVCFINSFGNPQGCFTHNYCFSGSIAPTPADERFLCQLECPPITIPGIGDIRDQM